MKEYTVFAEQTWFLNTISMIEDISTREAYLAPSTDIIRLETESGIALVVYGQFLKKRRQGGDLAMKKIVMMLCAAAALFACAKHEMTQPEENQS